MNGKQPRWHDIPDADVRAVEDAYNTLLERCAQAMKQGVTDDGTVSYAVRNAIKTCCDGCASHSMFEFASAMMNACGADVQTVKVLRGMLNDWLDEIMAQHAALPRNLH